MTLLHKTKTKGCFCFFIIHENNMQLIRDGYFRCLTVTENINYQMELMFKSQK